MSEPHAEVAGEVIYEVADHVATLRLNRPERQQNTITRPMLAALSRALVRADRDPGVRAVILTGTARFFCAGLDLRGGSGIGEGTPAGSLDLREAPPVVLHEMDTPVICAHNGSSAGYGMDLALGCDLQLLPLFASEDFREGMKAFVEKQSPTFRGR